MKEILEIVEEQSRRERRYRLRQGLLYLLDHHIHFIVLALAVIYLAYSWFSTQAKFAQVQSDNFNGQIGLSTGSTTAVFYRDAGTNRPLITAGGGDPLLEFTDWASYITVNGQTRSLWDNYHNYEIDRQKNKIYHSITYEDWVLFQEITVGPEPNRVLLEYYFRSNTKPASVNLSLQMFHYHFVNTKIGDYGFESLISGGKGVREEDQEKNLRYKLTMRVNLPAFKDGVAPVKISEGGRTQYGLINIVANYSYPNIAPNERTLLASQEVSWETIPFQLLAQIPYSLRN